jgi:hypothetical protein
VYVFRTFTDLFPDGPPWKEHRAEDWPEMRSHLMSMGIVSMGDAWCGSERAAEQARQNGALDGVRYELTWEDD